MALVLPEGKGDPIREEFLLGPVNRLGGLVVIAPARIAGDPGSIPGPGENFSLKLFLLQLFKACLYFWGILHVSKQVSQF